MALSPGWPLLPTATASISSTIGASDEGALALGSLPVFSDGEPYGRDWRRSLAAGDRLRLWSRPFRPVAEAMRILHEC